MKIYLLLATLVVTAPLTSNASTYSPKSSEIVCTDMNGVTVLTVKNGIARSPGLSASGNGPGLPAFQGQIDSIETHTRHQGYGGGGRSLAEEVYVTVSGKGLFWVVQNLTTSNLPFRLTRFDDSQVLQDGGEVTRLSGSGSCTVDLK
jgi:hypothetical protein